MEKQQRQQVEKNMQEAREKLESEMEDAYHEHQANLLRQGKSSSIFGFQRAKSLKLFYHISWFTLQVKICHSYGIEYSGGNVPY